MIVIVAGVMLGAITTLVLLTIGIGRCAESGFKDNKYCIVCYAEKMIKRRELKKDG